jgi:uncharacterized RDD family membrane protein YckC
MQDTTNPYAAPQQIEVDVSAPSGRGSRPHTRFKPVGAGVRFINFVLDGVAQWFVSFGVAILIVFTRGEAGVRFLQDTPQLVFGFFVAMVYYIAFEGATGCTLGKLVTRTRVVDESGGPASFGQIVGRTFSRFIPFEAFSFLGQDARGWHDSITGTYVVRASDARRAASLVD